MLELFEKYRDNGKLPEALLIGSNLFNNNSSSKEIFNAYFGFLCSLAEKLPMLEDKQKFVNKASTVLAFYSENVSIDEDIVEEIRLSQEQLNSLYQLIEERSLEEQAQYIKDNISSNKIKMSELYKFKEAIIISKTRNDFEDILTKVSDCDNKIDKEIFDEQQTKEYALLTKEISNVVNNKMRQMEEDENREYNKQAVASFSSAFKKFKNDKAKYKSDNQLYNLVSKTLFAFDASRLFNETLIFYNHVYSYIFNELDDDGKYALTRFSIECERKMN